MHQEKQQRKSDFAKFKELWFLLFMLLFTLFHNTMVILVGEGWSFIGYSILFLVMYALFRWLRKVVVFMRKPLSWGSLIGFYIAGVFVLGALLIP
ncbi:MULTISPECIES: hypothetical protein [Halobacillus]|uniref:Uncharacterized protein n=1 Tax=Halobacillus faecis TaxID=360184 RepID=A0A511WMD3_9BACI|nr:MULTISPECIES: hypothetical protein [Halobacillus]MBX0358500.1 hypothetical protein [Halobacillus sp. Nhm2S1]GEN52294.1 hypothetical protein HFA01_05560 [Halobacillus faecis]